MGRLGYLKDTHVNKWKYQKDTEFFSDDEDVERSAEYNEDQIRRNGRIVDISMRLTFHQFNT